MQPILRAAGSLLLGIALAGSLGSTSAPAQAAVPPANIRSSSTGISFFGSNERDQVVFSRAGTPTAPLVVADAFAPLEIFAGCSPVTGDPTRAICVAPIAPNGTLRPISVSGNGGDDAFAHGASLPIPMHVSGGPGRDAVNGGPADDVISGGADNDVLKGGDGTDSLLGATGDDVLDGGPGRDDDLDGGSGADRLFGGEGDSDDLDGGTGGDVLDGGPGRLDVVLYDDRTSRVSVILGSTAATNGEANEQDTLLSGIENAVGGSGDDFLSGDEGNNNLLGGDGADTIRGLGGQDAVVGGDGDDVLTGNIFTFGANPPANADGVRDFIAGQDGDDICIRSPADQETATDCEKVVDDD